MSSFSFLILLIRMLSQCPLVSLAKGLSILLIFSKNQLLLWFILWIVLLVFTWLISPLSLIISCRLLLLGEFAYFSSRSFRCVVKLLMCALSSFFLEALRAMSFHLRNAFIVSHKFGYVVASFSLNSKKSLISFFIPSLTKVSLKSVVQFPRECWLSIIYVVIEEQTDLVHGDLIGCMGQFQYFCICWGLFCDLLCGQFWRRYHEVLRRRYILLF